MSQVILEMTDELKALAPKGPLSDKVLRTVAVTMNAQVKKRIHEEGKAADGTDIGQYSRNPIYVSVAANPGKSFGQPTGKRGSSKFKSGKKAGQNHRSKYFPGGYNEFKTSIGRNTLGKVNLSLSGQLNNQLTVIGIDGGYGLGWLDDEKFERAKGFENKYGKPIWTLTSSEEEQVVTIAENVIQNALSE